MAFDIGQAHVVAVAQHRGSPRPRGGDGDADVEVVVVDDVVTVQRRSFLGSA